MVKRECYYASFLIRIWRKPDPVEKWLAQIEHIPSGEQCYFASFPGLLGYIREQLPDGNQDRRAD